jgi:hypothetical protein
MACVWSFANETGIVKYEVVRTYNEPTDPYAIWELVTTVNPNGSKSYKIIDSPVYPGFISYQIKAINSNGIIIKSAIITEKINSRN